MKQFFRQLLLVILVLFIVCYATACATPQEEDKGDNQVSAKQVIDDSVANMENMFSVDAVSKLSLDQAYALVLPNQNVDYEHERTSIIRGSCFSMYTAEYVSDLTDFEIGTTYIDKIESAGMTLEFLFRAENVEDGITANMEMHQTVGQETSISKIQLYFHYDYQNEIALDTTIVSFGKASIALAKLDYQSEEAFSYEFNVEEANYENVKSQLSEKKLDFDKFIENEILRYKFAKINVKSESIQAYSYVAGQEGQDISTTQEQLKAFYNDVYAKVKNECVERDFLDKAAATQKVYYENMYAYARDKVMQLA